MAKKIEIALPIVDIVEITYAFVICKENIMWQLHIYMYSATGKFVDKYCYVVKINSHIHAAFEHFVQHKG